MENEIYNKILTNMATVQGYLHNIKDSSSGKMQSLTIASKGSLFMVFIPKGIALRKGCYIEATGKLENKYAKHNKTAYLSIYVERDDSRHSIRLLKIKDNIVIIEKSENLLNLRQEYTSSTTNNNVICL